tara:strand:+ start:4946 stop:5494 length:549 start_codon:yes stop_codon:yes gene_type:complete
MNKTIAVVGNGPLTEWQKDDINKYDIVYRFNHAPGYRKGDKISGLYMRQIRRTNKTHSDNFVKQNSDLNFDKIYIGVNKYYDNHIFVKEDKDVFVREEPLFKKCSYCKNGKCSHDRAKYGPTSGILGINDIMKKYPKNDIHIYGMNWNWEGKKSHHLNNEGEIIKKCCRNCFIHKTPSNTYR